VGSKLSQASCAPRRCAIAGVISAAFAIASWGCAPAIEGPVERQRAIDRDDGDRLAAQLALLPGVVAANVVLHHAIRDPLGMAPPAATTFGAVITVDDQADAGAIRGATARLARAAVPELAAIPALAIEIDARVHRPTLAKVGPFWVEQSSRAPLRAALAVGCLAIAGLAGTLALRGRRHRRGNSAQ
jgi:hypothetical protein